MGNGTKEALFLSALVLLVVSGIAAALRARRANRPIGKAASPWMMASLSLVFIRHWAIAQEFFRRPADALPQQVEKISQTVLKLQGINDWIFHNAILIGIPTAFLLGFIFHMAARFALRWVFRIPIFMAGCASLFVVHQIVTRRADGVSDAVGRLWSALSALI